MKEVEIRLDGLLQIQIGRHPEVSDERREQCAREVADAGVGA
jgi:hypothetical protein